MVTTCRPPGISVSRANHARLHLTTRTTRYPVMFPKASGNTAPNRTRNSPCNLGLVINDRSIASVDDPFPKQVQTSLDKYPIDRSPKESEINSRSWGNGVKVKDQWLLQCCQLNYLAVVPSSESSLPELLRSLDFRSAISGT
jgi:hypothetical protein